MHAYVASTFNSDITPANPSQPLASAIAAIMNNDEAVDEKAKYDDNESVNVQPEIDPTTEFVIRYIEDHHITPGT